MTTPEDRARIKLERIHGSHRLSAGRCALIVVDMQHGFLDDGFSLRLQVQSNKHAHDSRVPAFSPVTPAAS